MDQDQIDESTYHEIGIAAQRIRKILFEEILNCGLENRYKMSVMGMLSENLISSLALSELHALHNTHSFEDVLDSILYTIRDNMIEHFKRLKESLN